MKFSSTCNMLMFSLVGLQLNVMASTIFYDDVDSDGRFLPSMPVDHLIAELARWFGVSATDLPYVLPNIGNFIVPSQTPQPIGFIKAGRIT